MSVHLLELVVTKDHLAVCMLDQSEVVPSWATQGHFFSITRTADELSIVCPETVVPERMNAVKGWRCFRVVGSMDFSVVGVLASLTAPLAGANVGIFAISTFDTDYLLVQEQDLNRATEALRSFGHRL